MRERRAEREQTEPTRGKKSRNATKLEDVAYVSLSVAFPWHLVSDKSRNKNILTGIANLYIFL